MDEALPSVIPQMSHNGLSLSALSYVSRAGLLLIGKRDEAEQQPAQHRRPTAQNHGSVLHLDAFEVGFTMTTKIASPKHYTYISISKRAFFIPEYSERDRCLKIDLNRTFSIVSLAGKHIKSFWNWMRERYY